MKAFYAENRIDAKTRIWVPGLDGWKPVTQVAQLKWTLASTGTALLNESQLAHMVLQMLLCMCTYFP